MTIDWSKAPEGAQWCTSCTWYKQDGSQLYYWCDHQRDWCTSAHHSIAAVQDAGARVTPRPSEPKPYTRDEALRFLVERLDSWPTDITDAPLCPGWGWEYDRGVIAMTDSAHPFAMVTEMEWCCAKPNFVPFVSLEDAQPATGQKFDTGKPLIGAIPPHAELAVARVMTFGAQKYARDNWRKIDDIPTRYMDAALRHLNAVRRGETVDPESGEHHLAHAACCILFMLDVVEAVNAQTDR